MLRRKLHFDSYDDVVAECQRLLLSEYISNGSWSLGQICRHLRLTLDPCIDGYPRWMSIGLPLRPILRRLMLPRLLRGDSPAGIKTAGKFVPPDDVDDAAEVAALIASIQRLQNHTGYLHPHPGFGKFDAASLEQFNIAHAAHHLGFLADKNTAEV